MSDRGDLFFPQDPTINVTDSSRNHRRRVGWLVVLGVASVAALVVAGLVLSRVDHPARGVASTTFVVDCDFEKFRQIMVRKNATRAMVQRSGMKLIKEDIKDVAIDTTGDDRPLLNAILGRTKSNVSAIKRITVELNDPAVRAKELVLRQEAQIRPDSMNVVTASTAPAENLLNYRTTLSAQPASAQDTAGGSALRSGGATSVTVGVDLTVVITLPRPFTSRADAGVQQSAQQTVGQMEASMKAFIDQHVDDRLILPELN